MWYLYDADLPFIGEFAFVHINNQTIQEPFLFLKKIYIFKILKFKILIKFVYLVDDIGP